MKWLNLDVEKILTGPSTYPLVVIRNIVVVLIVLFIFSLTETKFEVVVLSVLILIAFHQFNFEQLMTFGFYDTNLNITKMVRVVLIELKPESSYAAEWGKEISRSQEILDGWETKLAIDSVFYYFLWLVIIWKIVSIM